MDEITAYKVARGTQKPVALPPLPNGTIVIINPNGVQNNFVNADFAKAYLDGKANEQKK